MSHDGEAHAFHLRVRPVFEVMIDVQEHQLYLLHAPWMLAPAGAWRNHMESTRAFP
jgi:hypothetical protein